MGYLDNEYSKAKFKIVKFVLLAEMVDATDLKSVSF